MRLIKFRKFLKVVKHNKILLTPLNSLSMASATQVAAALCPFGHLWPSVYLYHDANAAATNQFFLHCFLATGGQKVLLVGDDMTLGTLRAELAPVCRVEKHLMYFVYGDNVLGSSLCSKHDSDDHLTLGQCGVSGRITLSISVTIRPRTFDRCAACTREAAQSLE